MQIEYIAIDEITPAKYNPREIDDAQAQTLQRSIKELGFFLPIIVNRGNNTIIAGHQRSKNAKAVGLDTVPAFFVENISVGDEIKFNQLHNGVEGKYRNNVLLLVEHEKEKFITIPHRDFKFDRIKSAVRVTEICKLILKYGDVFCAVVCGGEVAYSPEYVFACKYLNKDVNVFILADEKKDRLKYYLLQDYGKYSYRHIEKETYVQGLAQLYRNGHSKKTGKLGNRSRLYAKHVFPYLDNHLKSDVFDFGCGKGDFINIVKKRHNALGLEFYNNNGKVIDVDAGNCMIDALIKRIKIKSKFDVVVCDSVLNSVDSPEAESAVVTICNLFCSDKLFISGRLIKADLIKQKHANHREVYFLDGDNFSAIYREGKWFFQHFHSEQTVRELLTNKGFDIDYYVQDSGGWFAKCTKASNLTSEEYIKAIDFEFDLPLPGGKSYGRHKDVKKALCMD